MALIKCKECGKEVSSKAESCPKCGAKVATKTGCGTIIGVIFLAFVIFSIFANISGHDTPTTPSASNSAPVASTTTDNDITPSVPEPPIPEGQQWIYSQDEDKMSSGITYHASVLSSNTVNFDFPYSGEQHARLTLRIDPRYGKDVIFHIEKGQILCHSYEDCNVLVRFDDGKAITFTAGGAADNSTETIFIRNYGKFVDKLQKAKLVRISTNIYQEGAPVFEFDISGFDKNKFKPGK